MSKRRFSFVSVPAVLIVGVACGLPVCWIAAMFFRHPEILKDLWLSPFRAKLLFNTLLFNSLAAIVATLMGLPAGWLMGRNRNWLGKVMWVIAPGTLLMPFLAFNFGWAQFFRMFGVAFYPGGIGDTLRCIWVLGSWLWGIPALVIGLAFRQLDPNIQLAGLLDGRLFCTTIRALLAPLVAALAMSLMLATQQFAVYEPTGVPVTATEVRMVFATGAFSSAQGAMPEQEQRAAAAVAMAAPLLWITALLCAFGIKLSARFAMGAAAHNVIWPRVLDTPKSVVAIAGALAAINLGIPLASLLASLKKIDAPSVLFAEFGGAMAGSCLLFAIVVLICGVLAFAASAAWTPGLLTASGISFFLGGEILAIALIRIFNRSGFEWVYHAWPLPCLAYVGRFGCIALLAAQFTWTPAWKNLRLQAAHDEAGAMLLARRVIWPLAWPILACSALLAGILSLGEVDATGTLVPENPSVLTTVLLTAGNIAHSNRLVEGSLLAIGLALGGIGLCLVCWRIWIFAGAKEMDWP